jgi:outer membrane protein assembly factor BamB
MNVKAGNLKLLETTVMNFLYFAGQKPGSSLRITRVWLQHFFTGMVALFAGVAAAQAPSGRVYVSSEKDNRIYVFDTQGTRLSSIEVCKRPRHMMFNARQTQIYVSCGDSNQLGIVDTASGKMTEHVALGDSQPGWENSLRVDRRRKRDGCL